MKAFTYCIALIGLLVSTSTIAATKALQLPAIQVAPIQDSATKRNYELYIKLPEDYEANRAKPYPTLYVVDALYNIEVISGSIEYFFKDAIVIGISWEVGKAAQRSRLRDYMPNKTTNKDYKFPTGMAHEHLAFLHNDVFQFIESTYHADPKQRSYYGFSVGGTFGSYILLTQPESFKNYIIGSPSTLFGENFIYEFDAIVKMIPDSISANVFVSVGSDEKPHYVEHAIGLTRFLQSKKAKDAQLKFSVIESADHGKAFPISAIQSLRWLGEINSEH